VGLGVLSTILGILTFFTATDRPTLSLLAYSAMVILLSISGLAVVLSPAVALTLSAMLMTQETISEQFQILRLTNLPARRILGACFRTTLKRMSAWWLLLAGFLPGIWLAATSALYSAFQCTYLACSSTLIWGFSAGLALIYLVAASLITFLGCGVAIVVGCWIGLRWRSHAFVASMVVLFCLFTLFVLSLATLIIGSPLLCVASIGAVLILTIRLTMTVNHWAEKTYRSIE